MSLFLEKIQQLFNQYIALDPESKNRLITLHKKVITVELKALDGLVFQLYFFKDKIYIKNSDFLPADTIIKGTPLSLLHLSLAPKQRKKFFAEDVSMEGNLELGQQVIALLDELEIDWEEYISQWVGDIPAHKMGYFAKKIKAFSINLAETLLENINEFTHEEIHLFPPPEELEDFFQEVDTLRMDVDRLDAKINNLMQSIEMTTEA
jgi:ubiquinone biosynthesis protein UbiJ